MMNVCASYNNSSGKLAFSEVLEMSSKTDCESSSKSDTEKGDKIKIPEGATNNAFSE